MRQIQVKFNDTAAGQRGVSLTTSQQRGRSCLPGLRSGPLVRSFSLPGGQYEDDVSTTLAISRVTRSANLDSCEGEAALRSGFFFTSAPVDQALLAG